MNKKSNIKNKNIIYFTCLFINYNGLLLTVCISCYLIKYKSKQNKLLQYHITSKKLRQVLS